MNLPTLEPIEYQGELVALVSPTRIRIISPQLRDRPEDDYDRRFVIFMCLCCREALNGCRRRVKTDPPPPDEN